jgi:hypothetical protein
VITLFARYKYFLREFSGRRGMHPGFPTLPDEMSLCDAQ